MKWLYRGNITVSLISTMASIQNIFIIAENNIGYHSKYENEIDHTRDSKIDHVH